MAIPRIMALDQALAEVEVPPPDPGRWAGQLADVARHMRTVIGRHRDVIPGSIGFLPGGSRALRCHERVLAIPMTRLATLFRARVPAAVFMLPIWEPTRK